MSQSFSFISFISQCKFPRDNCNQILLPYNQRECLERSFSFVECYIVWCNGLVYCLDRVLIELSIFLLATVYCVFLCHQRHYWSSVGVYLFTSMRSFMLPFFLSRTSFVAICLRFLSLCILRVGQSLLNAFLFTSPFPSLFKYCLAFFILNELYTLSSIHSSRSWLDHSMQCGKSI